MQVGLDLQTREICCNSLVHETMAGERLYFLHLQSGWKDSVFNRFVMSLWPIQSRQSGRNVSFIKVIDT